jgi:hypothetical protein
VSFIESAVEAISQRLHPGMLVVLDSTTYAGTTERVVQPLLESRGLKAGVDFFLAFSRELVDPGNGTYTARQCAESRRRHHGAVRGARSGPVQHVNRDRCSGQLAARGRDGEAARAMRMWLKG